MPPLSIDYSSRLALKNRNRIAESGDPYGKPKCSKSSSYIL